MVNQYTLIIIKNVIENVLFIKSSYEVVLVILSCKDHPIKALRGTRRRVKITIFEIESFTKQKYEVSLLQQILTSVINEYLPEWNLEFFLDSLGISKSSDTYIRKVFLEDIIGETRKSTIKRLLSIALGVRNYVSLDYFPTKERVSFLIYYLFKIKKQIEVLNRSEFDMNQETFEKFFRKAVNYYSFLKMIWREFLTRDENRFQ